MLERAAGEALLARLDAALNEVAEVRRQVVALMPPAAANGADDFADDSLLDTTSAQERFGIPRNTLALWCRTEGLGVRRGGRWLISIGRLQRHINGK